MKMYARAVLCVAFAWAGAAAGQSTIMSGDSSGSHRKPGTQGAIGTAGASTIKGATPSAAAPSPASQSPLRALREGHGNRAAPAPGSRESQSR
jgi:hypothetical protein